jgi:hypothetical protein
MRQQGGNSLRNWMIFGISTTALGLVSTEAALVAAIQTTQGVTMREAVRQTLPIGESPESIAVRERSAKLSQSIINAVHNPNFDERVKRDRQAEVIPGDNLAVTYTLTRDVPGGQAPGNFTEYTVALAGTQRLGSATNDGPVSIQSIRLDVMDCAAPNDCQVIRTQMTTDQVQQNIWGDLPQWQTRADPPDVTQATDTDMDMLLNPA